MWRRSSWHTGNCKLKCDTIPCELWQLAVRFCVNNYRKTRKRKRNPQRVPYLSCCCCCSRTMQAVQRLLRHIHIVYPIDCRLFVLVIGAAVISCNRSKCHKGRHALFNSTPKKKKTRKDERSLWPDPFCCVICCHHHYHHRYNRHH